MTFKFTVPGKPQPKQRPRFTYSGMTYTPKETVAYEKAVRKAYEECGGTMFKGAVSAFVRCFFEIPQSYTKKRRAACEINEERPIGKNLGDCDNLAKAVLDALNGVAFKDDSQVVDLEVRKLWGSPARVEVILRNAKILSAIRKRIYNRMRGRKTMSILEKCPSCGKHAARVYKDSAGGYYIECDCGAMILDFESEAEAVAAWNTRAGESE